MSIRGALSRRRLLSAGAAASLGIAGCLGEESASPSTNEHTDLDLREANVVDVAVEADGQCRTFGVTLHHDDNGEEGYANWWQVERPDSEQLGRRELLHPHSQQPFTRSETITIPDAVPVSSFVVTTRPTATAAERRLSHLLREQLPSSTRGLSARLSRVPELFVAESLRESVEAVLGAFATFVFLVGSAFDALD
ncbi:hypothetical protein [Halovenus halobia]|uniref:hypothetical protein n=1 Tax=Halovenus halobia TaxID=3396622 RepID=UPI003F54CBCB